MWNEKDHPRDILGRFTKKEIDDMTADELKELILVEQNASGAVFGAYNNENDPENKKRTEFANNYYAQLLNRNRKIEVTAVARNLGMSYEDISKVFAHVFELPHLISGIIQKFDPDYDMAQSWFRLREGKNIQEHDIILIKHELMEAEIMGDSLDIAYEPAHAEVEKIYNYQVALDNYLRNQKK